MTLDNPLLPSHSVGVRGLSLGTSGRWVVVFAALVVAFATPAWTVAACDLSLRPPVSGEVLRPFDPTHRDGHWGVDLASSPAAVVRSPVSGEVTFAGRVAGMQSVTVAPSSQVRVSLSYLSEIWVVTGQRLTVGQPLGRSGSDHGRSAVHLSLRVGGRYVDPLLALACGPTDVPVRGILRLLPSRIGE